MKNDKLHITTADFIKANKIGSRNAELEISTFFVCTHKVHKSPKNYTRKDKHKSKITE